jgi:hypothetical protein
MGNTFPADAEVQSSGLRADEFIEPGNGFAAGDGDRPRIHLPPWDIELIEVITEDPADIRRAVTELVSKVRVLAILGPDGVHRPASVRMN